MVLLLSEVLIEVEQCFNLSNVLSHSYKLLQLELKTMSVIDIVGLWNLYSVSLTGFKLKTSVMGVQIFSTSAFNFLANSLLKSINDLLFVDTFGKVKCWNHFYSVLYLSWYVNIFMNKSILLITDLNNLVIALYSVRKIF